MVTLLQSLPLVCSGSAAHGIARKNNVTSMGLLRCQRGPLRGVPGLQQEGIRVAVGIARVILWADYMNLVQHLKDKHAPLHREFQQKVEVQNAATLSSSLAPFWQISLRA